MKCDHVQEDLSAYLDGELEPGEVGALKEHLESCESCRAELESLRKTVSLVRTLPRVYAPAALKQRVMSATGRRSAMRRFPDALALVSAAALVLVAVVAIFMLVPRETIPTEVTANGLMPKTATETGTEECDEYAIEELGKKGWSAKGAEGAMPSTASPAVRRGARQYEKKQTVHEADRKLKAKEEPSADFSKLAKAQPGKSAAEEYPEEEAAPDPASPGAIEQSGQKLTRRELIDRMNKALKEDLPATQEKLAGLQKEAQPQAVEGENGASGEKLADARKVLENEKLRSRSRDKAPFKGEKADGDKGITGEPRVEELVLEADNVNRMTEAVTKLAAAYDAETVADEKSAANAAEGGAGGGAGAGRPDTETRVLIVQIDRARYREFMDNIEALKEAASTGSEKRESLEKKKESGYGRRWGSGKKDSKQPDAETPVAKALEKPVKPAPPPEEPPTEDAERGEEKKAPAGAKHAQEKEGKELQGDALPEPPPAPPRAPETGADTFDKLSEKLITLRIKIVRSKPAARLDLEKARPAKPEPAERNSK